MQDTGIPSIEIRAMKISFRMLGVVLLLVTFLFLFMYYIKNYSVEFDPQMADRYNPFLSIAWIFLLGLTVITMMLHRPVVRYFTVNSFHHRQMAAFNWSTEKYRQERFDVFRSAKMIGYAICGFPAILSLIGFLISNLLNIVPTIDFHFNFLISPIVTAGFIFLTVPDKQVVDEVVG